MTDYEFQISSDLLALKNLHFWLTLRILCVVVLNLIEDHGPHIVGPFYTGF